MSTDLTPFILPILISLTGFLVASYFASEVRKAEKELQNASTQYIDKYYQQYLKQWTRPCEKCHSPVLLREMVTKDWEEIEHTVQSGEDRGDKYYTVEHYKFTALQRFCERCQKVLDEHSIRSTISESEFTSIVNNSYRKIDRNTKADYLYNRASLDASSEAEKLNTPIKERAEQMRKYGAACAWIILIGVLWLIAGCVGQVFK